MYIKQMYIKQVWAGPFGYFYSYDDAQDECDTCSSPDWMRPKEEFVLVGEYTNNIDGTRKECIQLFKLTPIKVE